MSSYSNESVYRSYPLHTDEHDDDRVSLPEDFEAVMKALLETPPAKKD